MKIKAVRTHILEAALSQPFAYSRAWYDTRTAMVVEIETDDGLVGWGECYGPARITAAVVQTIAPWLIGQDPLRTEFLWQMIYARLRDHGQKGAVIEGLSGIDIALWDIKGKHFGVPVHRLLGGPLRSEVQAYATGLYRRKSGDPLRYLAEEAAGYVAEGFKAVKLKVGFGVEEDAAVTRAVREAIGPDIALMVDANHAYDAVAAIRLGRMIEPYDIGWFEEPVPPEDVAGYRAVKAAHFDPDRGWRMRVHAVRLSRSAGVAGDRYHPARYLRGRRLVRMQEDRRHGRGVWRALQPARLGYRHRDRGIAATARRSAVAHAAFARAGRAHAGVRPNRTSDSPVAAAAADRACERRRARARRPRPRHRG